MNYHELIFTVTSAEDFHRDLLIDSLSTIGFDTFQETESGFNAYIASDLFDEQLLEEAVNAFRPLIAFSYEINLIPAKNWNEVWESNFEPLIINDQCCVRATFHEPHPEYLYEIVIDPKMSFGTGHHQTTSLMIEYILETDLKDKSVLDMGCGTGILSILASKAGASEVYAIDYDPICHASTIENSQLNNTDSIKAITGSKEAIPDRQFDVILANINRNILLDQMESYAGALSPGGILFLSGFYQSPDLALLSAKADETGLTYVNHKIKDDWVAAKFFKTKSSF